MFFNYFTTFTKTIKRYKFKRNTKTIFFKTKFCLQFKVKYLSLHKKNNAGKGSNGTIVFRNRGSILKKFKQLRINFNYRLRKLYFIANFHFIPFRNKLVTLVYFMDGNIAYFNTTTQQHLFSFGFLFSIRQFKKTKFKYNMFWATLFFIKKLTFICCFEKFALNGIKFVRSPGTKSRIEEIDKKYKRCLVFLPSKQKLSISFFSSTLLGQNALKSNRKFFHRNAGYWRTFGKNSIVRGVAMNPVDHPHGGRTKSIKYPRTPWGKTTKYK